MNRAEVLLLSSPLGLLHRQMVAPGLGTLQLACWRLDPCASCGGAESFSITGPKSTGSAFTFMSEY